MNKLKKQINEKEYNNEFSYKLLAFENHFKNIYKACSYSFEKGCGSYLFDGQKYEYQIETYQKQKILYEKAKNKENILEIGTYMGHSLLIILMANPSVNITCIDINDRYSLPSIRYLQKEFPESNINFIKSDSLKVLKGLKEKYDLIHIDGAHNNNIVTKEFYYCMNLIKERNAEFIFDDRENVLILIKNIIETFFIKDSMSSKCIYSNLYLNIIFPENKFIYSYKKLNFILKNNSSYIFLKIKKLLRLTKYR